MTGVQTCALPIYTQPVLYGHFPGGKTEIMRTVALAGFAELAASMQAAVRGKTGQRNRPSVASSSSSTRAVMPVVSTGARPATWAVMTRRHASL